MLPELQAQDNEVAGFAVPLKIVCLKTVHSLALAAAREWAIVAGPEETHSTLNKAAK
jgi:hypothetical protein